MLSASSLLAVESDLCFLFQPLPLGLQLLWTLIPLKPYTQIYPLFLKLPLVSAKKGRKSGGRLGWDFAVVCFALGFFAFVFDHPNLLGA